MSTADQENSVVPPSGRRLALVVGVNGSPQTSAYLAPLQFAESSATALAKVLQENCDFELLKLLIGKEATKATVEDAIIKLAMRRTDQDFLLFYFVGHGYPMLDAAQQRNVYLVTEDFDPSVIEDLHYNDAYYSLSLLNRILYRGTRAGSVLIILDCCYGGNANDQRADRPLETIYEAFEQYFSSSAFTQAEGKTRMTLSAARRDAVAWEGDDYSVMAKCLLDALSGKYLGAVDEHGYVTLERLQGVLREKMPDDQKLSVSGRTVGKSLILATYKELSAQGRREREQAMQRAEREHRLRAMFSIASSGLMQNRYASFVGRENELAELHQYIDTMMLTGGYVTLIEPPGKGKSSIIAKLVHDYSNEQGGLDHVAYHFIPLTPEADHPVVLLRDLLAHLVLKHGLFEIDVSSENRAVLSQAFSQALNKIHEKGKKEVIFIDGLDQLETVDSRILSFLPREPDNPVPGGIVFVLGTRPKDMMSQVELFKPSKRYPLPNLSRPDFDLILQHRVVKLESKLADSFYEKLEQNALYLDLVAKELAKRRDSITEAEIAAIIKQISDNPENLFSLATNRLRTQAKLWEEVMKPVLGLLLVTNEPLSRQQIRQLTNLKTTTQIDGEQLNMGLEQLGGLIIADGHQRYTLFHLKFRDYLREDPDRANKRYIFDHDDEPYWHQRFVAWCEEGGLARIWGDGKTDTTERERRRYARHHYIFHLYSANSWEKLFNILDDDTFGKAKIVYDPSTRSYALDLDLGRHAATSNRWNTQEAIQHLPHLWRYTLLRCSLASRADKYPLEAFRLMLLLEQEPKAQGLAELITDPAHKVEVFALIASHIATSVGREREAHQMLMQAEEIAKTITDEESRIKALVDVAAAYALAGQEQQAQNIFQQAEDAISSMKQGKEGIEEKEIEMLIDLVSAYASIGQEQQVQRLTQQINAASDTRQLDNAFAALASAYARAGLNQQVDGAIDSMRNIQQSDNVLAALVSAYASTGRWQQANKTINSISDESWKTLAWIDLAIAYAQTGQLQQAQQVWQNIEPTISTIQDTQQRDNVLAGLATTYVRAERVQQIGSPILSQTVELPDENVLVAQENVYAQSTSLQVIDTLVPAMNNEPYSNNAILTLAATYVQVEAQQRTKVTSLPIVEIAPWGDNALIDAAITNIQDDSLSDPQRANANKALVDAAITNIQAKLWNQAETAIGLINDTLQHDKVSIILIAAYTLAELWQKVEAIISYIWDDNWRDKMWVALTATYVEKRWWQRAEAVLSSIQDEQEYDNALSLLAGAYAKTEQWQQAEAIIASISDQQRQEEALAALTRAYAHAGHWQEAEAALTSIKDEQKPDEVFWADLAIERADEGRWQDAEIAASYIKDEQTRDRVLADLENLPVTHARAGRLQQAEAALPFINDISRRNQALIALVSAYAEARQWQQAEDHILRIQDKEASAKALTALADAFAKNNEYDRLLHLIHEHWLKADTRDQAILLLPLAFGFIPSYPDLGIAFRDAFTWVDEFLRG